VKICNGFTLLCALPCFGSDGSIERYSIAAVQESACRGQAVAAYMGTLDDDEWYWGTYFNGRSETRDAMPLAIRRAVRKAYDNAKVIPGESIPSETSRG